MKMRILTIVTTIVLAVAAASGAQQAPPPDPQLGPATDLFNRSKEAYDNTQYEVAAAALDEWIAKFAIQPIPDERRRLVISAYELRARARQYIGRVDDARNDFRQILLFIDPSYQFPSDLLDQRVRSLFDEVRRNVVGAIDLSVTPPDATVTINGKRVPSQAAGMSLPGSTYTLVAVRPGYRKAEQPFTVLPGTTQPIAVALERVSSNVTFITTPSGVEVFVDGESKGKTELDPSSGSASSKPFVVTELPNGRRRFEFRLACHRNAEQPMDLTRADDYPPVNVRLEPAMGTITVTSTNAPNAQVILDGGLKGTLSPQAGVPFTLHQLCEGPHTVEVHSLYGRDIRRVPDLKAGQTEVFAATLRPAFAIVSDSGLGANIIGGRDYRGDAESEFGGGASFLLFAPDESRISAFAKEHALPSDWLKVDLLGDRIDGAGKFGDDGIRRFVTTLSDVLNVQGVAAVARRNPNGDPNEMLLILRARGSAFPDVIPWRLDDRVRAREVVAAFDKAPPLLRSSIGLTPIDVLDVAGAAVAAVESGGRAEESGIRAGEVISGAGGTPIKTASQLLDLVASRQAGPLTLEVRSPNGAARQVEIAVVKVPSLISLDDESLWSNRLAAAYTALAAERTSPLEQLAARLNLAVVQIRLKNYADAMTELGRVEPQVEGAKLTTSLSEGVMGTTQYLIGICADALRDSQRAAAAWKRAAQARGNLLTEDGGPLQELATRRLEQLPTGRIAK